MAALANIAKNFFEKLDETSTVSVKYHRLRPLARSFRPARNAHVLDYSTRMLMSAPEKQYMAYKNCWINIRKWKKSSPLVQRLINPPIKYISRWEKYIMPLQACVWYNNAASLLLLVYENSKRKARTYLTLDVYPLKKHVYAIP